MKTQKQKFITFLESIKTEENSKIIGGITDAFNILSESEIEVDEKIFEKASENFEDQLPGGLADDKKPSDFDKEQLVIGMMVELEHTADPKLALEIAMDHLAEHADYYERLLKMEKEAEAEKESREGLTEAKKDDDNDPNKICVEWDKNMKCTKWERRTWAPFLGSRILGIGYPFLPHHPHHPDKPDGGNGDGNGNGSNGTNGGTNGGTSGDTAGGTGSMATGGGAVSGAATGGGASAGAGASAGGAGGGGNGG